MPPDQANPDEVPGTEQILRYRDIQRILRAYAEGKVSMAEVEAIPREEILACRRWVNDASVRALIAELPEFGKYED